MFHAVSDLSFFHWQAPPTFAPTAGYPPAGAYPGQPLPAGAYPGQPLPASAYPGQPLPAGGPNTTYVVQGGFDAGARFDGTSPPSVPVSI